MKCDNVVKKYFGEFPPFTKQDCEGCLEYKQLLDFYNQIRHIIDNIYTDDRVRWFDSGYAKNYGELCTMAGAKKNRQALIPIDELERIAKNINLY